MFDMLATLLSLFLTTLIPLFSVYKLLKLYRTSGTFDPELLSSWLIFYGTLSVFTLAEATVLNPLTYFLPLYPWFRLLLHAYLLLPAPQGAAFLWSEYIHPFLFDHEDDIERYIATASEEVRVRGGRALEYTINWFRENMLGQERVETVPAAPQGYAAYAQGLLSRFYGTPTSFPTRQTVPRAAGSTTDLYSAVMSVLQSATASATSSTTSTTRSMPGAISESVIIPPELANATPADRLKYIRQAQQGLSALMQAFAREEARDLAESQHLDAAAPHGGLPLTKSKSEAEFDRIEHDEADGEEKRMNSPKQTGGSGAGGWIPWNWNAKAPEGKKDEGEDVMLDIKPEGRSSGIDL